jgi:hypothetical protein
MSDLDPSALARRLNDNRNRVLAGEEIPEADYAQLIEDLRQNRLKAASPSATPRKKGNVVNLNLEPLV